MKLRNELVSSGRDVLVVEDEPRLREMLSRALREMGFEASLVSSGESALRMMEQRAFDILILDLNLPGISGMHLLEQVRRRYGNELSVIILSGFGDLEAARRAIQLEVVEFLTKPCALGSLEAALDRARRKRGKVLPVGIIEPSEPEFEFVPEPRSSGAGGMSLEELEQQHILAVLEKHGGNRASTAAELGISLRKLYYRLSQYQKQGLLQ